MAWATKFCLIVLATMEIGIQALLVVGGCVSLLLVCDGMRRSTLDCFSNQCMESSRIYGT
jgi:hypothetical protein